MTKFDTEALFNFAIQTFAEVVQLQEEDLKNKNYSLIEIVANSEILINSVDIMEAFAKTANRIKREFGIKVRLPSLPMDTAILDVMAALIESVENNDVEEVT